METRRTLIKTLSAGAFGFMAARTASAVEGQIEVLPDEPIGTIAPEIYGHFIEHIGGVIYDGIWVGENSRIPNLGGIRKQLVDALRPLKPSVVRWPGGCFADSYDWHDGIGPRDKRPRRVNFWITNRLLADAPDGPQKYEPNEFGTHEFMHFAKLAGAQPYLAANVRSLPARDFYEWIDYCNAPAGATTLADMRAANGDRDPFRVRYWGVGNESWGCGGDMTPDEYAMEFRRFTSFVPAFDDPLRLIASGPNGGDFNWTNRFFSNVSEKGSKVLSRVWGWALHYYCGTTGKGISTDFSVDEWYELLGKADRMESLIRQHWTSMGEIDREHKTKLVVDEWGAWHKAGTEVDPAYLFGQTPSMRDALVSALTLDTFNRHADKVGMANVAQLVNNLHALFLAREDQFTVTPNYHVFKMYTPHQGGIALPVIISAPRVTYQEPAPGTDKPDKTKETEKTKTASLWGLAGSASLNGKMLTITVVNPHATDECATNITVRGKTIASASATVLSSRNLQAHNSFASPRAVEPVSGSIDLASGVYKFKPASVTRLDLTLA